MASAQAILERGEVIDPNLYLDNMFDLLALDQGITQGQEIVRLAEENLENLEPGMLEWIIDFIGADLTERGFETAGLRFNAAEDFSRNFL